MRAFVVSLLVVSAIAVNADSAKKVDKRGVLGGHGYSSGGVTSGIVYGGHGTGGYLPPVQSVSVIKKPYPVLPAATYGVPSYASAVPSYASAVPSYASAVPVASYGVPALAAAAGCTTSLDSSIPSVGIHTHVPVYNGHVSAPVPAYSVHSYAPAPVYGVPAAVSHPVSVGSLALGTGSLSGSYGVPSSFAESVPAAGVSFGTLGYPSKTYGYPSNVAVGTGLSLSHLSVPSKSYGVPAAVHGTGYSDLSFGSINLPSTSYGVPSNGHHGGHGDGYSYPVPSNKLLV